MVARAINVDEMMLIFDKHIFMGQSDGDLHQIGLCHAIVSTFNVFCFGSSALLPECSVYSMNAYVYELGPTPN